MERKPYTETQLKANTSVRFFSIDVDPSELKWHWDREDRIIYSLYETDWKFQIDDELPQKIDQNISIAIKKGTYHRLIKGTGNLHLVVAKFLI